MHGVLCVNLWLLRLCGMCCSLQIKHILIGLAAFAVGVGFANQFSLTQVTTERFENEGRVLAQQRLVSCVEGESKPLSFREMFDRMVELEKRRAEISDKLTKGSREGRKLRASEEADLLAELARIVGHLDRLQQSANGDGTTKLVYRQTCYEY